MNSHFKVETGLKYTAIQDNTKITGFDKKTTFTSKHANIAAPFTLQYYFIPERSHLRAYCGAGVQYNVFTNAAPFIPFNSDISADHVTAPGTKYISVMMTQGITFQISTRIQLTESFHFIPLGAEKSIGLDLGVGYNIR